MEFFLCQIPLVNRFRMFVKSADICLHLTLCFVINRNTVRYINRKFIEDTYAGLYLSIGVSNSFTIFVKLVENLTRIQ